MQIALVLVIVSLVTLAAAQTNVSYGYCTTYPGNDTTPCYPYTGSYFDTVFFYTPSTDTPEVQRQNYLNSVAKLFQLLVLTPTECQAVIKPFVCQNLFAPCLVYPLATSGTFLTVRKPTCQSVCQDVHSQCSALFQNSYVMDALGAYPEVKPFLLCNNTDPNLGNIATFPDAPGWSIQNQTVACAADYATPYELSPVPQPTIVDNAGNSGNSAGRDSSAAALVAALLFLLATFLA